MAENFYTRFLPQAREAAHGDGEVLRAIRKVEAMPEHAWKQGLSAEDRAKIDRFYQERYGGSVVR